MSKNQHIIDILTGEACWVIVKFKVKKGDFIEPKEIVKVSKKYTVHQIWRICQWILRIPNRDGLYYVADANDINTIVNLRDLQPFLFDAKNND